MPTDSEILDSLLGKLYSIVVGRDDVNNIDTPGGSYISFTMPGIPVDASDLDFSFVEPSKADAAADYSSLVNGIPPVRGRWMPSDRKVDAYYRRVLAETIRPVVQLSQAEKTRLEAAYARLTREVEAIDLTTGTVKKVPADTPLFEAYQERQTAYLNALSAYKSLQFDFISRPADLAAQANWFARGPVYKQRVQAAYSHWLAGGKKMVEEALHAIEELGRGSGERWSALKTRLRDSEQLTPEGATYLFTKYFPGKFWDAAHEASWTKFVMKHDELHTVDEASSTNWGGKGAASFGLWSLGGSASYAEQKTHFKSDGNVRSIEVELIRVPIRRSWWDPTIFWDRGWKFDPQIANIVLSNGAYPPVGEMPAYATAMIVARNLKLDMSFESTENSSVATQFSASASVGWGPFSVRGNYSRNTSKKTHDFVRDAAGLSCAGMQIVGFVCETLPKSPNPDPDLNWQG